MAHFARQKLMRICVEPRKSDFESRLKYFRSVITLLYDESDWTKVITKNVHRDLLVMSNP